MKNNDAFAPSKDASAMLNRLAETVIGIKLGETRKKLWSFCIGTAIFGLLLVTTSVAVFDDASMITAISALFMGIIGGIAYFKANNEANTVLLLKVQLVQEYFTTYEMLCPNKDLPAHLMYELRNSKLTQGTLSLCSPQVVKENILDKAETGDIKGLSHCANVLMNNRGLLHDHEHHQPVTIEAN